MCTQHLCMCVYICVWDTDTLDFQQPDHEDQKYTPMNVGYIYGVSQQSRGLWHASVKPVPLNNNTVFTRVHVIIIIFFYTYTLFLHCIWAHVGFIVTYLASSEYRDPVSILEMVLLPRLHMSVLSVAILLCMYVLTLTYMQVSLW